MGQRKWLLVVCFALLLAKPASAEVQIVQNFDALPGYVVNDILINAPPGDSIGAMQLLLEPSSNNTGDIYQFNDPCMIGFPCGPGIRPSGYFVQQFPAAEWDTFVAAGQAIDGATPLIFGASVTLGGAGGAADLSGRMRLDATYAAAAGQNTLGVMDFLAARITLSEDYSGSFAFLADFVASTGETPLFLGVRNGVLGAPEPTAGWVCLMALTTMSIRRRNVPTQTSLT